MDVPYRKFIYCRGIQPGGNLTNAIENGAHIERPWLASYPPGVPERIEAARYASLDALFTASCREFATRPALWSFGATLDYAALDRLARDFAAYLQGPCGVARGDRVAVMLPNMLAYPVALLGALRAVRSWSTPIRC